MIRPLTDNDIPLTLVLCCKAGLNQLQADWLRLFAHEPDGCFVAELDGQIVGTVTTTRYGTDLAWIGMMLVDDHAHLMLRTTWIARTALTRAEQDTSSERSWGEVGRVL